MTARVNAEAAGRVVAAGVEQILRTRPVQEVSHPNDQLIDTTLAAVATSGNLLALCTVGEAEDAFDECLESAVTLLRDTARLARGALEGSRQ